MKPDRLNHFREILEKQLAEHTARARDDQAAAIETADDGVKDSLDMSMLDLNTSIAFRLGEKESQMVADIDQALLRIDEGSYGQCARCGKPIDERRLEAMPTARYDAACQAIIEEQEGQEETPSL